MTISLSQYASEIRLYEPFIRPRPFTEASEYESALEGILRKLVDRGVEKKKLFGIFTDRRYLLRALLNVTLPDEIAVDICEPMDRVLWTERLEQGIVLPEHIPCAETALGVSDPIAKAMTLWQGDITKLAVDAVVNAANNRLLGCFVPLHRCIDNAIHSAAGPQLRDDCARIMHLQGHHEPAGIAKISRAYNLPSRYVLHTVGPIVDGPLTDKQREALASCYRSCLGVAAETGGIRSVAFCCISTGEFSFPPDEAARIAIQVVVDWLREHPATLIKVIFNVFTDSDHERYRRLLFELH